MNPDVFIFDIAALERDELVVRYPLPFSSLDLPDAERLQHYGDSPVEYSLGPDLVTDDCAADHATLPFGLGLTLART
jgi:hypothetical protein